MLVDNIVRKARRIKGGKNESESCIGRERQILRAGSLILKVLENSLGPRIVDALVLASCCGQQGSIWCNRT